MSEHLEFDPRAYDREIGAEAAFALNGLHTLRRLDTEQPERLAQLDALTERLEETTERHIGRRPENDTLFVGSGVLDIMPTLREPWSAVAAEAQLADAKLAEMAHNKTKITDSVQALTEPYHTSFLDKVPQQPRKRWFDRAPKPITWNEQDAHLHYAFEITPNADSSFGFSNVTCKNIGQNYEFGVVGHLDAQQGNVTRARISWRNHMDFSDAQQVMERQAPGLWDTLKRYGIGQGWGNQVIVDCNELSLRLVSGDVYQPDTVYRYDASQNLLMDHHKQQAMTAKDFLEITEQILSFLPTITEAKS